MYLDGLRGLLAIVVFNECHRQCKTDPLTTI